MLDNIDILESPTSHLTYGVLTAADFDQQLVSALEITDGIELGISCTTAVAPDLACQKECPPPSLETTGKHSNMVYVIGSFFKYNTRGSEGLNQSGISISSCIKIKFSNFSFETPSKLT